jgi:hypothetical protein
MSFKDKSFKSVNCKECGHLVKKVGIEAISVICHMCVNKSLGAFHFKEDEVILNEDNEKKKPRPELE